MLTIDAAIKAVLDHARPLPPRRVALARAAGLVLAENVVADLDLPPFDKSTVDGFAVRIEDIGGSGPFQCSLGEEILAGQVPSRPLARGEAALVMTGAPLPPGAGAVVMIEQSARMDEHVSFRGPVTPGQNVLKRAREMKRGDVVLEAGVPLTPARIGLLASVGCVQPLAVPRCAARIVPTGDELVSPDQYPGPGQIRESNSSMLRALALAEGADASALGLARDELPALRESLGAGLESDVLIVTGGVSAGKRDLVPEVLESLGVTRVFHKVRVKPGKPIWFGVGPERPERPPALVFGLPGNPVSGIVGFLLFARPAFRVLHGRKAGSNELIAGRLLAPFAHRGDRPTYHPAICDAESGIKPLNWAGSADLRALAGADGFAVFAAGDRDYTAGETIQFMPLPSSVGCVTDGQ
jgi:molybdopterin molybdotransferase